MSLPFDLQSDFAQVVDGIDSLTLRRTTGVDVALPNAIATSMVSGESGWPGSGAISQTVTWEFALPEGEPPPRIGDSLLAAGNNWRVNEVELPRTGSYVRCRVSITQIVDSLINRVDIEEARLKDGVIVGWQAVRAATPASLQLAETVANHSTAPATSTSVYRGLLEDSPPLDHRHRLRSPEGKIYQINKYRPARSTDSLPEVEATLVPDAVS